MFLKQEFKKMTFQDIHIYKVSFYIFHKLTPICIQNYQRLNLLKTLTKMLNQRFNHK
jgi:hypothetical protein